MAPLVAMLIKSGLSIFAGAVAAKGADYVKEKTGVDLAAALGTEEGRLRLKQLEMEHQALLIAAAQATEARDLDYFKAEVADRDSARDANVAIATSEHAPFSQRTLLPFMAYLVTAGFFGSMAALFYVSLTGTKLDDNSRDILIYAFGAMTGGWMLVMNYLYGSSHGSRLNQEALASVAKRGQV